MASTKSTAISTAAASSPVSAFAGKTSQQPTHVYVKNIPPKMSLVALTKHFSQFGQVCWRQRQNTEQMSQRRLHLTFYIDCVFSLSYLLADWQDRNGHGQLHSHGAICTSLPRTECHRKRNTHSTKTSAPAFFDESYECVDFCNCLFSFCLVVLQFYRQCW